MSDGVNNFVDNSELIEYLKSRKEVQTEVEMKNIMGKIYECIALKSKLFFAFNASVPPMENDNLSTLVDKKLAFIYSEKAEPYLPVYTTLDESKNRGNTEQFPYIMQINFSEYVDILLKEHPEIEGLVINPFTDNLVLSKSKIEYLMKMKNEVVVAANELKEAPKDTITSKITGKASINSTSGTYIKSGSNGSKVRRQRIFVNEYDLRILEYNIMPFKVVKAAIAFAKTQEAITAMWLFDKRYYLENDNMQYLAQLFVIEDTCVNEEERMSLYNTIKATLDPHSNANEIHVENIENQRNDFIRKNAILPFYQKISIEGNYEKSGVELQQKPVVETEVDKIVMPEISKVEANSNSIGWESIEAEFFRVYPTQINPKHYAALIKWKFGGPDPLDGISVYDAGDYWHFVTFGLSELYEKESENKEVSGHGLEFTYKLKKGCYDDEESEIKATCALLQQIAKIVVVDGAVIKPNEYLYTGQTTGIDSKGISKITGFITISDTSVNTINTPNGRVEFIELVGVTDNELKSIMEKKINVRELFGEIKTDITDYKREEILI